MFKNTNEPCPAYQARNARWIAELEAMFTQIAA
jgi:hypothetical protein